MQPPEIRLADPLDDDVARLIRRHLEFGRASSPPEDAHALEVDDLLNPTITLFSARCHGELLSIGALKEIDAEPAEVKTMHTVDAARGRGIGRAMLDHLLAESRRRGYRRVSLETGTMDAFEPARSLYLRAGFSVCEPFGDYRASPNSVYLMIRLDEATGSAQ